MMKVNVEAIEIDGIGLEVLGGRVIAECAKAFGVFRFDEGDEFVDELGDGLSAAPAHNIRRDFIDDAQSEYTWVRGAVAGGFGNGIPGLLTGLEVIKEAEMFVPGHIHHNAEAVFEREVEEPHRRHVINTEKVGSVIDQELEIEGGPLQGGEKLALRIGGEWTVGNSFKIKLLAREAEEFPIHPHAILVLNWRRHFRGNINAMGAAQRSSAWQELNAIPRRCQTVRVRCEGKKRTYLRTMEKKQKGKKESKQLPKRSVATEKEAREVLSKPPAHRRPVTIGPTSKSGPDITLED
jgi:hypothetical protein